MNRFKLWPHGAIVAAVLAVIAGLGVWLYANHEQTAQAETLPNAARIQRIEGGVAFCDDRNNDANSQWTAATINQPFSEGDRIYTRDKSRTSLAFSGRNFARLDPNTSLDIVSLGDRRTQLALRDGSAMFDVGYLQPNELFEVATPNGAIDFAQPGLYNVGFDQKGAVLVSVLSGLARVVGQTGSGEINKGEMLTLLGQTATELALSRLNRQDAGYQVDDYYRYQYPNSYDGRYSNYDTYLNDPNYYDPYQRNVSYKYASANIPGLNDLDAYGDWQNVGSYGYAWRPRVDAGWVPYQQGQWTSSNTFGPTWVSSEPWGYAPYHYGRWANVNNQWYWVPETVNTTPSYAPALVAFVSGDNNQMGWVPLGPGDAYAPRYYDENWQPRYLTRNNIVPSQLVNFGVPGAVTVVPLDAWGHPIDRRNLQRIDPQRLASMRPTLDPLTLTPLRNAMVHSAWGRGKMDLPPGIAKKLYDTRVFVGNDVMESRFHQDRGRAMRVERISDQARNQKFKVRDERQQASDTGRGMDMGGRMNGAANKDNKDAEKQARQLEQQQRKDTRDQEKAARAQTRDQEKAQRQAQKQAQGERVGKPAKSEAKPKTTGAPKEGKQKPPAAQPGNQGHQGHQGHQGKGGGGDKGGGGKGKGKKP